MSVDPDAVDRKILAVVQENNQLTTTEIGAIVGLSKSAVQRRLAALHAGGEITADVAVLDPGRVCGYLSFVLQVTLTPGRQPERMERFNAAVRGAPAIQQCYHVTGSVDYFAIALVKDQAAFAALTKSLLYDNPDVARFESSLVVDRTKVSLQLPLP